ncbi:hypothetical protein [Cellulomonas sp. URHB0016]
MTGASWYENLIARSAVRRARIRGPAEFTGALDRQVVVPTDTAGRPGYRLTMAGSSNVVREYVGHGRTTDFFLRVGPSSHLVGSCNGPRGDDDLRDRATTGIEDALRNHVRFGVSCVAQPTELLLAGERAVGYTLAIAAGPRAGTIVTDALFDHDGWCFTVGAFLAPWDGAEAQQMTDAVLASWTWLPRAS